MTDSEVTRFPGVHQRSDSAVYWFALRAPVDLAHHFPGPWAVRQSLRTKDLREANDKARQLQAQWAEKFGSLRRADKPQQATLTADLTQAVCAELRRWVLAADDNMRSFPEGPRALLTRQLPQLLDTHPELAGLLPSPASRLTITAHTQVGRDEGPEVDPLAGLSWPEHGALARFNAAATAGATTDMARRNLRGVQPLAEAVVRSMGLAVDWNSPEGRTGLLECLKAYTRACSDVVRRDAGDVVDTPQEHLAEALKLTVTPTTPQPRGHTPRDAYNEWEAAKPGRPRKTLATYSAATDKLAALLPGRTLESLTRADGRHIEAELRREALAKGGNAQNTAVNLLGRFRTLLEQAVDLEWIEANPLDGRSIERLKSSRKAWSLADLPVLFDDPLFTDYALPDSADAGKDAAYWLPLLGLFTGARISELAQLHTDDVKELTDAGWVLSIDRDTERGQRVKNEHSIRSVPVHPELIRLGFIDYWRAIASHGPGPLWPAVTRSEMNGAGGKVSQWFGEYKTAKGFGPQLVFHSFRHTMETQLRALSVPKYQIDAITGHAGKTVSDDYDHPEASILRLVLEKLTYTGLTLQRVFKAPE